MAHGLTIPLKSLHAAGVLGAALVFATSARATPLYDFADLGTLGGRDSNPVAINNSGQVTGTSEITPGSPVEHGFLYSGGRMTDLGTLIPGGGLFPMGMNDAGDVVGQANADGGEHAFLYSGGRLTDLGSGVAYDINRSGQIVGSSHLNAFLYESGTFKNLGTLGGANSYAAGINNLGQVVGAAQTPSANHAFLYTGGPLEDLGTLGGPFSQATRINDAGQITGSSTVSSSAFEHGFLYSGGRMTDIGTFGGHESAAYDINSSGTVVGFAQIAGDTDHAALYRTGMLTDLNSLVTLPPGGTLTTATGINDAGQIVGTYVAPDGFGHAYLLIPAPEPALLPALGLSFMFARRRRDDLYQRTR